MIDKTSKPKHDDSFAWDVAGNKVAVYLTGIPDFDTDWDVLTEEYPTTCTHYVVMVQRDGETTTEEFDYLHAARHAFMVQVNNSLAEFNS